MKHKIVEQAVRWLEKMGIEVEYNEELQQFEFEYKGAFVIIDANPPTPRDVFSIACPYIFPDETSSENKAIFEKVKQWWAEHTDADYCFCEMVDNDCAVYGVYMPDIAKVPSENMNCSRCWMKSYTNGIYL